VHRFASFRTTVVIRYSLGEQRKSGLIHDTESFEMLVHLLRWRPQPILVIDPFPDRIAERIAAAVHRRVATLSCRWNVLAEFILSGGYNVARQESARKGQQALTSQYRRLEDAFESETSNDATALPIHCSIAR
jgi:hypothetical protein